MRGEKYNGWCNYETWVVSLHFSNCESEDLFWTRRAEDTLRAEKNEEDALYALSEEIRDELVEGIPGMSEMYLDLLGAAISEIDTYEIAQAYIENAKDSIEDEDEDMLIFRERGEAEE